MKATVVKKYELTNEEARALEKTKEILDTLCYEGFEDDFSCQESVYLSDVICAIDSVIDNNGTDWV